MYILRQPPFPLNIEYGGLLPEEDYFLEIYTDKSRLFYSHTLTSNEEGKVFLDLPEYFSKFDAKYALYIYSLEEGHQADVMTVDTLSVYRPYINPNDFVEEGYSLQDALYRERIVRSIIDVTTGGFYYTDDVVETTGMGADYLSLPNRINKINQVYRNNVKVYDRAAPAGYKQDVYVVTPDNAAITIKKDGVYNRHQAAPQTLPLGASDSFNLYSDSNDPIAALTQIREFAMFPKDFDYVIFGEFGWPVIPQDIQDAARMLFDDLSCNKLQYVSQYIKEYRTDQFTIKYDDLAVKGTGNAIVDQILSQYHNNFYKIGIL